MRNASLVFLGALMAMALSWFVMILAPQTQLGAQVPVMVDSTFGISYPGKRPGAAEQGREVYRSVGCFYCHSQQVRPSDYGSDFSRGWGRRWTVAQDYIGDEPVMLGNSRLGPDLANMGVRRPADEAGTNLVWHLVHLYNPQIARPGSTMPPYAFLFETRKIVGTPSPDALKLPESFAAPKGFEIVPKPEAVALARYMLSLDSETQLFEASLPPIPVKPSTNAPAAGTTNTVPVTPAK